MLEEKIDLLITAINNLAAAVSGKAPVTTPVAIPEPEVKKGKKEKVAPTVTPEVVEDTPTEEQMMQAGQKILDKGQKPKIVELNKKFGVERGRELLKDPAKKEQLVAYYKELVALADAA